MCSGATLRETEYDYRVSLACVFLSHLRVEAVDLIRRQCEPHDAAARSFDANARLSTATVPAVRFCNVGVAGFPQQEACRTHCNDVVLVNTAELAQQQRKPEPVDH